MESLKWNGMQCNINEINEMEWIEITEVDWNGITEVDWTGME
jgi:hypothetical protein